MESMGRNPEKIAECIRKAGSIAIASHVNPDGDTLGSATAMYLALKSAGKEVSLFCDGKVPDQLAFLPAADMFRVPEGNEGPFDLMLAVDVSDPGRLGKCAGLIGRSRMTAQIDHHSTNPMYMQVNSVDGTAPATCILILEQIDTLGIPLTKETAVCLYTGISTDTGNFAFASTNAEAFRMMARLMEQGLPLGQLNRILFREKSRAQILLLGKALSTLVFRGSGRIAVMKLTGEDFKTCGALSEHADTLVNYGLDTTGTMMALLAREDGDGRVKMSLRAREPYRVDDTAKAFGGGGHPQASGISMNAPLEEAVESVVNALEKKLQTGTSIAKKDLESERT